jgi:hypothetical protein
VWVEAAAAPCRQVWAWEVGVLPPGRRRPGRPPPLGAWESLASRGSGSGGGGPPPVARGRWRWMHGWTKRFDFFSSNYDCWASWAYCP